MEEKKLSKHLQAAVNQLEKQVEKMRNQYARKIEESDALEREAKEISEEITSIQEQIKILKG